MDKHTEQFNSWWDSDTAAAVNPYAPDTPIWWAWEGWVAAMELVAKETKDDK